MSIEERPRAAAAVARRSRRFRVLVTAVVGVLVIVVGALTVAGALTGPRLRSAVVDAAAATQRADQRLVMTLDQPVGELTPDQVTIDPAAPVEIDVQQTTLTLRFTEALRAATRYSLTLAPVVGEATGVASELHYSFRTPALSVLSLERSDAATDDRIVRTVLGEASGETLFSAPRIQEFARLAYGLAVATLGDDDHSELVIAPEGERLTQPVPLPSEGQLRQLQAADTGYLFGFVFSPDPRGDPARAEAEFDTLYLVDPLGTGEPVPVPGLDGAPLQVMDWAWVPGTSSLVAQAIDTSLFLIDATGASPPTPLGQHVELRGFLPGTRQLVVADPTQGLVLDLQSGEQTVLDLPPDGLRTDQQSLRLLLRGLADYLEVVVTIEGPSRSSYRVVHADRDGWSAVYRSPDEDRIAQLCLAPNGQYAAVELEPRDGELDHYPERRSVVGARTVFVDLTGAGAIAGAAGIGVDWCR